MVGLSDIHIHLGKSSGINQYITPVELLKLKEKFEFLDKVLIMGTDLEFHNKTIPELVHKHEWLYGLHWWENNSNKVVIDDKMIGVKYHGAYTGKPVTSINPRNLQELDDLKAILMVHCGRYLEGDIKSNTSYLHAIEVARKYPNIKVILAHMGGTDTTVCKKAIHHATNMHNVYFDTSGITTPYIIEHALEQLPSTHILFGSDIPWCSFNAMIWTVADSISSHLQKQDIYHDNFELLIK